ncbi:MAG: carbohydrate binding domain-containing protein, partial [Monoglobaceae bacterium]
MRTFIKKILSAVLVIMTIASVIVMPAYADSFSGWTFFRSNNSDGSWKMDSTVFNSGTASMKIVNNSPITANVFVRAITKVNMVKGRKYDISLYVKSNKAQNFVFMPENWEKRYSLTSYGSEYDWRNFEFSYIAAKGGNVELSFLVEGYAEVWVDSVKVIDRETGQNILANGEFDIENGGQTNEPTVSDPTKVEALDDNLVEMYNKICESDSFSQEAIETVRGAFKYMPVYPAKNITIDGNGDDWADYPAMGLPTLPSQYTVFSNDGGVKDITAKAKFAHDDEAFYLYIEVTDDIYVYETSETYWIGDSIQLTISDLDEVYGSELGLTFNPETGDGEVWGIGFSPEQRKQITYKGMRKGNKNIYEAKIPWKLKYNKKPDEFLFDFLVCDNDGSGRRYVLELAPGIAVGKMNDAFPVMEVLSDNTRDWYGWTQGPGTVLQGEEAKFQYFLVNGGEEKTFTMTDSITGKTERVKVPAKSGIRREIVMTYDELGKHSLTVDFECGGEKMTSTDSCTIERKPADEEFAYYLSDKLEKEAKEIKALIDKCEAKGIDPQYEKVNYIILDKFSRFVIQDLKEFKEMYRMYYTEETTDKIYSEAKAKLEAYLAGEDEPASVPRYVTSDIRIDGQTMYAMTDDHGKKEERPVFFVGYVHGEAEKDDIEIYTDLGYNTVAEESGPTLTMSNGTKWSYTYHNNPTADYHVIDEGPDEDSRALEITYQSEVTPNQFFSTSQSVPVEPGKTYIFKGKVKSDNAGSYAVSANNYDNRISFSGTTDWKDFSTEYTAPAGKTSTTIRLMVDAPADSVCFSKLSFKEKGAGEDAPELLVDGSFVNWGNADALVFDFNSKNMKYITEMLDKAEKNNVNVTFL